MNGMPSLDELLALMRLTFQAPRAAAGEVLRQMPGREALWLMFGIVVVLTVMAGQLAAMLAAGPALSMVSLLILQGGAFLLVIGAMYQVGRFFGGSGSFDGALILVTWLQFVFLVVQLAQIAVFLVSPALAGLIALVSVALFVWFLVNFTAELHGFAGLGPVFLGVIGTLFGLSLVLYVIAVMLGIELQMGVAE